MIKFNITPYDVLFFGDGRPFNAGESVQSTFPPHPTTFAGAICARLYSQKKINVSNVLNSVYGPFIEKNGNLLLPKPCNVFKERKKKESEKFFILENKMPKTRLFNPENTNKPSNIKMFPMYIGSEQVEGFEGFITLEGLKKWLDNKELEKEDIVYRDIFEYEQRVGIKVEPDFYSVAGKQDSLYRVKFIRLKEEVNLVFWADLNLESLELKNGGLNSEEEIIEFYKRVPRVLKLGGENKGVRYSVSKEDFKQLLINRLGLEEKITLKKGETIRILLLSYGDPEILNSEHFEVVSACYNGYKIVGINSKHYGRYTKRMLPPGTVIWAKVLKDSYINSVDFLGKSQIIGSNLVLIHREG